MRWQVFYTPHTDDESIGMAGAIVRARMAGDCVMVVLVTANAPSAYMTRVFGYEDRVDDLAEQRRVEWSRAMSRLDVTEMRFWNLSEEDMIQQPFAVQAEIEERMSCLHDRINVVHHHTVWGTFDIHPGAGIGSIAHGLCANALTRLSMRTRARASLYGVYVYAMPEDERRAPQTVVLSEVEMAEKRRALDCYKASDDTLGYGYRSVPELIDNASNDPREFVLELR